MLIRKVKYKGEKFKIHSLISISHEIRNQINGIIGLIELLENTELSVTQKQYIDMLRFSADRLLSIINRFLDFSKIRAKEFEQINNEFDLLKFLKNIANYFKIQANNKGLEFHYRIDDLIPKTVIGDSEKLSQVLFNLLGNAIKFTERGCIRLEVDLYNEDMECIKIGFKVIDTGTGIPIREINSLFKPFKQLNKKYRGTGLGLTISKKLIELMGGEIEVRSILGEGSVFGFKSKFLKNNSQGYKDKILNIDNNSLRENKYPKLNILVGEDDIVNQKIIGAILEKNNWIVTIATNGEEILEHLANNNFDIILMDINIPKINGIEVARVIRDKDLVTGRHTPIVAITGITKKEYKDKCFKIGMDGFVQKPIKTNILYQTIISVLNKHKEIKDLNLEQLIDRIDGNKDVLKEIIEEVLSDDYEEEYLCSMKIYIEKGNLKSIKPLIHKFKGSISNFDEYRIINILEDIDLNINKNNVFIVKRLFNQLKTEFGIFKDKLRKIKY